MTQNSMVPILWLVCLLLICPPTCQTDLQAIGYFEERMNNYTGHIYFLFTDASRQLSNVASCAVQTAALLNPMATVTLLSQAPLSLTDSLLNASVFNNIRNEVIPFQDILKETPSLLQWYLENEKLDRKNFKADLSDALRFAIIANRGGVYLDTDMISLKPFSYVPVNSIGKQLLSADRKGKVPLVNGAAMFFQKGNRYINECIRRFSEAYNPKKFGTVGPELLW